MKSLVGLLFIILLIAGCKQMTEGDIINNAAIHFSGVFITENVKSVSVLRIEGRPDVKKVTDSTYYVSGFAEGFSPINYPINIKHFNELLRYLGLKPNERKSWECIEIYVGNKKMK